MPNPYKKRRLKEFLWITLLGFGISFAFCPKCFFSIESFLSHWRTILLSLLYTYLLGYGCTFLISKIENRYSWLEHPKKKFFLHFVSLALFSFIVSAVLFYIFAYLMFNGEKWLTISETLNQAKLPAFISVSIAAFFTGTDFLKNWKTEAVRAERLEKEKISTQYESLRNQVNPHFLFNSLNALSELVYENQDLAVKYIRQLSQVYRYVLDSRNNEVVSIHDELEFLNSFIFLQKIRFGDNLDIKINLDKDVSGYVLPLSLQILMENAIKHNVVSKADPLCIRLDQQGQYLVFMNKVKRKKSMDIGTGIGLENIRMRYKYLTEVPVLIDERNEEFTVKIPILTELP
jgi:sensor histidine kinase YesM